MTLMEDQVRAATKAAAEIITPDSVPPLRLAGPSVRVRITAGGRRRPDWRPWAAPLAAAAAVIAVVIGMAAIPGGRSPGSAPPRTVLTAGPPVTAYTGAGVIPAYYVVLASDGNPVFVPSHGVVRSTASGRMLATIPPPAHGTFVAVTAAADDRTFVLGEQPWAAGKADQTFEPETFFLLKLGRSGNVTAMTRLPGILAQPQGSMVTGLALSPDGRELAVAIQPAHLTRETMEIRVYPMPGGAGRVRTWSGDGTIGTSGDDSAAISWTADGQALAFDWSDDKEVSVRLLDATTGGGSLVADSRVAVLIQKLTPLAGPAARPSENTPHVAEVPAKAAGGRPLSCGTDEIISSDGSVIVCGASAIVSVSDTGRSLETTARHAFLEYSVATGRVATIIGEYEVKETSDGIGLYWSSASGKVIIAAIPAGAGTRIGILSGQEFTPLPGTANLGAAAW